MREWLYGRNPVYESLRARRRHFFRLLVAQGIQEKGRLSEALSLAERQGLKVERVRREQLDRLADNHQGIVLEASGYPYTALADILDRAGERGEDPFILVLDSLKDPQNMGTLLRSAEAAGMHGVLIPLKRTAMVTPAVVSASSGASEHLLLAQANLAQSIQALKEAGLWVVGLDAAPSALPAGQVGLDGPLALVVGSEGEGMHALVRQSCDTLMRLPMRGNVGSLNASVAGSVAVYFALQSRLPEGEK
jgi:23S rRNA (guanosine2251-2'-O)-methyltransferase